MLVTRLLDYTIKETKEPVRKRDLFFFQFKVATNWLIFKTHSLGANHMYNILKNEDLKTTL